MKKKLLTTAILLVAAVALVVTTMLATMAYLSESAAVSNTFTVGNVSIEMYESPVGANGLIEANKEAYQNGTLKKTSDGNSYHLVPGKTFDKDPSIYVKADSEDCYLFIKVRNQIRPIEDRTVVDAYGNPTTTMKAQVEALGWKAIYNINADETIYVYQGTASLGEGDFAGVVEKSASERKIDLFTTFTVADQADISKLGGAKVTITAFAIQGDIHIEGGQDSIAKTGDLADMQRLWNVVAGEFEFENVTIPDDVIRNGTIDPTAN